MNFRSKLIVAPGARVRLKDWDPGGTLGLEKGPRVERMLEEATTRLNDLQYVLYAEDRRAVLLVLQGMDASGKDSTIRHVMRGANPQGCTVTAFKEPSHEELQHDFLWRVHKAVPRRGELGIFNRSHYEDVLIVRVNELQPKEVWKNRYEQINRFEKLLAETGVSILKCFLHISKEEQKKRFLERLEEPRKHWKFSPEDLKDRGRWDAYAKAYEDALERCSTDHTPWFTIPADKKWFRNLAVASLLVETLEKMDLKFPKPAFDPGRMRRLLK